MSHSHTYARRKGRVCGHKETQNRKIQNGHSLVLPEGMEKKGAAYNQWLGIPLPQSFRTMGSPWRTPPLRRPRTARRPRAGSTERHGHPSHQHMQPKNGKCNYFQKNPAGTSGARSGTHDAAPDAAATGPYYSKAAKCRKHKYRKINTSKARKMYCNFAK